MLKIFYRYFFYLCLVVLGFSFWGCDILNKVANEEAFTYEYTENGCNTGKHSFSTLDAYCAALENNSLNNNCAVNSRQSAYYQKCSGTFSPHLIRENSLLKVLKFR